MIPNDNRLIVVYGSYGYTGTLIVELCKQKNLNVLLSGRDENKLKTQHARTGYPFQVVDLDETKKLIELLTPAQLVIHCAGPFQYTSDKMVSACLETKTHYTDITGEFRVFESLATYDAQAKQQGIQIMPGTGFDVVPSDCLALHLKQRLPSATRLRLAFSMGRGAGLSRGTARTSVEGLGEGSYVRKNGSLVSIPFGSRNMRVDFGPFNGNATCIPWGDIATAFRSTGIPDIEVYMGMASRRIRLLKISGSLNWLLRMRWVKNMLRRQVDKKLTGPEERARENSRAYLWGKVEDDAGNFAVSRLETINAYSLTAITSVAIAERILSGDFAVGFQTPAAAYGSELIMKAEGSVRTDL